MASNPLQRKARNSFILGMLLMLILTGIVIAFLILQLKNYRDREEEAKQLEKSICVLKEDVKSGQIITEDMLEKVTVKSSTIPKNAIGSKDLLKTCSLQDKEGNTVSTKTENGKQTLSITINGKAYELKKENVTGSEGQVNYDIEDNNEKKYIELNSIPVLAKVTMNAKTIITSEMITKGNNATSDDIRKQEYNIIILPTQLQTGDYIDVRLSMPSGEDYIVVSKKEVTIPQIGNADSATTIWLNLSETEILSMSSAIMDAFRVEGSKLYATTYTEPGIQAAATPTYPVNAEVVAQLRDNPNAVADAITGLINRYNVNQRDRINSNIQNNIEDADKQVTSQMSDSITKTQQERQKYLDSVATSAKAASSSKSSSSSNTTSNTTSK